MVKKRNVLFLYIVANSLVIRENCNWVPVEFTTGRFCELCTSFLGLSKVINLGMVKKFHAYENCFRLSLHYMEIFFSHLICKTSYSGHILNRRFKWQGNVL